MTDYLLLLEGRIHVVFRLQGMLLLKNLLSRVEDAIQEERRPYRTKEKGSD